MPAFQPFVLHADRRWPSVFRSLWFGSAAPLAYAQLFWWPWPDSSYRRSDFTFDCGTAFAHRGSPPRIVVIVIDADDTLIEINAPAGQGAELGGR
jgi:hypothetical protein